MSYGSVGFVTESVIESTPMRRKDFLAAADRQPDGEGRGMPDMTDLSIKNEEPISPEDGAQIEALKARLESLRLTTHEDEVAYWLSDGAMQHD